MKKRWSPHHHAKLTVADFPVPILVHRVDHLVNLLVRHLNVIRHWKMGSKYQLGVIGQ